MKILLVEDEENLQDVITLNLEMEGYSVDSTNNGKESLYLFSTRPYDLVILDVMLPEMDGFTVCKKIREQNKTVPILFLTAKNLPSERVEGLKIGGDDYLSKPFNLEELLLRISKLLQRKVNETNLLKETEEYTFNNIAINFLTYEVIDKQGVKRNITKKEAELLRLLIFRKNEVVSREEILNAVWDVNQYPSSRTIDNFIVSFRKYFEKDLKKPRHFISVRGIGYKFIP